MNKKSMAKVGAVSVVGLIVLAMIFFILLPLSSSEDLDRVVLGEKVRIELEESVKVKVITPNSTNMFKASDVFTFKTAELGVHKIIYGGEVYEFEVVDGSHLIVDSGQEVVEVEEEVREIEVKNETNNSFSFNETENESLVENVTREESVDRKNISDYGEDLDYDIVVGKPVLQKKNLLVSGYEEKVKIKIPAKAENVSVKSEDGEVDFKVSKGVVSAVKEVFSDEVTKSLVISDASGEFEIEYVTPGPEKSERNLTEIKKEVKVFAPDVYEYENVLVYTNVSEFVSVETFDPIQVYWVEGDRVLEYEILDQDGDGLVDGVSWIVPHLSEQTFEISISVINVQSYPIVGGVWRVEFKTVGTEDLFVRPVNGTSWEEDLEFLEIRCGSEVLDYEIIDEDIVVENYSCNDSGFFESRVISYGSHFLEFEFGSSRVIAKNLASKWYGSGWNYRKQFRINASMVGSDLDDFPVLVFINDSDLKTKAQSNGNEILFADYQGNKFSHELELYNYSFNSTHVQMAAWVKMDLSSSSDNYFYMYYNNSVGNQEDAENVWDTNYQVVQHLEEAGTGVRDDSTSAAFRDAYTSGYDGDEQDIGKIGWADHFDGSNDYLTILAYKGVTGTNARTISLWWKSDVAGGAGDKGNLISYGFSNAGQKYDLRTDDGNGDALSIEISGGYEYGSTDVIDQGWHYLVVTFENDGTPNAEDHTLYVDGAAESSTTTSSQVLNTATNRDVRIGASNFHSGREADGIIDEVRISSTVRSADWINASYLNQVDPPSFYDSGSEESRITLTLNNPADSETISDFISLLNVTVSGLYNAQSVWYTLDGGTTNTTLCSDCSGEQTDNLFLAEQNYLLMVYANNTNGTHVFEDANFTVYLNHNFYESFDDNLSVDEFNGVVWDVGNVTYTGTANYNTVYSSLSPWARLPLSGNENDIIGSWSSTSGNDPSWTSNIIPSSNYSQAGDYNGVNDYTQLPDDNNVNLQVTTQRAISVWFEADALDSSDPDGTTIYEQGGGSNCLNVFLYNDSGTPKVYCHVQEGANSDWTEYPVNMDEVYHVGCVFDISGGQISMVVNGVSVSNDTALAIGASLSSHGGNVAIGGPSDATSGSDNHLGADMDGYFNGRISDLVYWGEAQAMPSISDMMDIYLAGVNTGGNFTSYMINTTDVVAEISNITWTESGTDANNNITIQISANGGTDWSTATKNQKIWNIVTGSNLLYRALFTTNDTVSISLLDVNISWQNWTQSPPMVVVETPVNASTISDVTPFLNVSINDTADTLWYNVNDGANISLCTDCTSGYYSRFIYVPEGATTVNVYANNTVGDQSYNVSSFTVNMSYNAYDDYSDNSSLMIVNNVTWSSGNMTYVSSSFVNTTHYTGFEADSSAPWDGWVDGGTDCLRSALSVFDDNGAVGGSFSIAVRDNTATSYTYRDFDLSDPCEGSGCDYVNFSISLYPSSFDNTDEGFEIWCDYGTAEAVEIAHWQEDGDGCVDINGVTVCEEEWTNLTFDLMSEGCTLDGNVEIRVTSQDFISGGDGDLVYMDGVNLTAGYVHDSGNFTVYYINTTSTVAEITNVTWTESGTDADNNITLEVSANAGSDWYEATWGGGLLAINTGSNLAYRAIFRTNGSTLNISLLDVNISWTDQATPPPTIVIVKPSNDSSVKDVTPLLNVSIDNYASSLWYNVDDGANTTLCTDCFAGHYSEFIYLEEGSRTINVYVNNSLGTEAYNYSSIVVNMSRNTYDNYSDNSSLMVINNVTWSSGNVTFYGSSGGDYNTVYSPLSPWARLPLSGDENDIIGSWSSSSGNDPDWVDNIILKSNYSQAGDYNGVDDYSQMPGDNNVNLLAATQRAISVWFEADALDSRDSDGTTIYEQGGGTNSMNIFLYNDSGTTKVYCHAQEGASSDWAEYPVNMGELYHVGCIFDYSGGQISMVVNGVSVSNDTSLAVGSSLSSHSGNPAIGGPSDVTSGSDNHLGADMDGYFNGRISDFVYWGEAQTMPSIGDMMNIYDIGVTTNSLGNFSAYFINTTTTIVEITNVTWTESGTDASNNISIQISPNAGADWYEGTWGEGIFGIATGDSLVYRAIFRTNGSEVNISLLDVNISWSDQTAPPPDMIINSPNGTIADVTPTLNVTLADDAVQFWYSVDGGANTTICLSCSADTYIRYLYVEEGAHQVYVYSSNALGEENFNVSSFTVDMNYNYFDTFGDNSSLMVVNNVSWEDGNVTFYGTSGGNYNTVYSSLSPWARLPLSGDENDIIGSWSSTSGNDPTWVDNILVKSNYSQAGNYDGSNDYTGMPDDNNVNLLTTTQRAISVWFEASNLDSSDPDGTTIYEQGGGTNCLNVFLYNDSGTTKVYCHAQESANSDWVEYPVNMGELYHIGCIFDFASGQISMVVNGESVSNDTSLAVGASLSAHGGDVAIGGPSADGGSDNHLGTDMDGFFNGTIADFVYWGESETMPSIGDMINIYDVGVRTNNLGNFTAYFVNTTETIAAITNVSWTESGTDSSNNLTIEVSADGGEDWQTATNNQALALGGTQTGNSLVYRAVFRTNGSDVSLSLLDMNISWDSSIAAPPNITINYPVNQSTLADVSPLLNVTLVGGTADELWYNVNDGQNITFCSSCSGTRTKFLYLEEGTYTVKVYADNPLGVESYNSTEFTIDMNKNYYDGFDDNSSLFYPGNTFNLTWGVGNVTFNATSVGDYGTVYSPLNPWARLTLSGDENDIIGSWDSDSGNDPSWVANIVPSSNYSQAGDYNGVDDYSQFPDDNNVNLLVATQRAISVWFEADALDPGDSDGTTIYEQGGGTNCLNIFLYNDSGTPKVYCHAQESASSDWAEYPVDMGELYHVGCIFDFANGQISMVVNGESVSNDTTLAVGVSLAAHNGNVAIGGPSDAGSGSDNHLGADMDGYFNGRISDLVYWGEAETMPSISDMEDIYYAGINKAVNFTAYNINTTNPITRIANITWSEYNTDENNTVSVNVSVDGGSTWYNSTSGLGVTPSASGDSLVYRVFFEANDPRLISLLDMNITWVSPPVITIHGPTNSSYGVNVTTMNYTVQVGEGLSLDACWYSLDGGATNVTGNCSENITGINSIEGLNNWTVYANDSEGAVGWKRVYFTIDTSAPNITFINQTDEDDLIVNDSHPLEEGQNLTIFVNVTDDNVDSVWLVVWDTIKGGAEKLRVAFTYVAGALWMAVVPTSSSWSSLNYYYTIYANDSLGAETEFDYNFSMLHINTTLSLDPNPVNDSVDVGAFGYMNMSNGTALSDIPINLWLDGNLLSIGNVTPIGTFNNYRWFLMNDSASYGEGTFDNTSADGDNLTLVGTNTTGSYTMILDAGARVNWTQVNWSYLGNSCSAVLSYQEGDSNSYSGTRDAYIDGGNALLNFGTQDNLQLDTSPSVFRSLIKFDEIFGAGGGKIPYNSTIYNANITIEVYDSGDSFNVYEILENWTESQVTYNYRLTGTSWSSIGLAASPSRSNTLEDSVNPSSTGSYTFDITNAAKRWNNQTSQNYGVVLHPGGSGGVGVRSSEYSTQSERPQLNINFSASDCTGIVVYYRTSNDKSSWSSWQTIDSGELVNDVNTMSRYLEYRVDLSTLNSSFKPYVENISFNYTAITTNTTGHFAYNFTPPSDFGSYQFCVNTSLRTMQTNLCDSLSVQIGISPNVSLVSPADAVWIATMPYNLTYNASDGNDDIVNTTLIINGTINATNSTPVNNTGYDNFTINFGSGFYNWTVNATDSNDNTGTDWVVRTFYVDLEDPFVSLIAPPDNSSYAQNEINLSFSVMDNMDDNLVCDVVLDGNTIYSGISVASGATENRSSGVLSAGLHYWNVTCTDEASRSHTSSTYMFNLTDTPPTVTLVSPNPGYVDGDGNISFIFEPTDNSGFTNCSLLINSSFHEGNQTPIDEGENNTIDVTNLDEGFYNWTVLCYDYSLLSDQASERDFSVDLSSPNIVLNLPGNLTTVGSRHAPLNFTANDNVSSTLTCDIFINSSVVDESFVVNEGELTNRVINDLADGWRVWYVSCTDQGGHLNSSETRLFNVQEAPIVFINTTNETYFTESPFSIAYTPFENSELSNCSIYIDGAYKQSNSSVANKDQENYFDISGVSDGLHTYYVNCTDVFGNVGISNTNVFTLDSDTPNVTLYYPDGDDIYSSSVFFNFSVTDEVDSTLSCNLTVDSTVIYSNSTVYNNTVTSVTNSSLDDGFHTWYVNCSDGASNLGGSSVYNFTKLTPPEVSLTSPDDGAWINETSFNLTYLPSDDEGLSNVTLILNGVANVSNSTIVLNEFNNSFTVNLTDGVYNWTVNVTDVRGMVGTTSARTFYVDTEKPVIVLKQPNGSSVETWNNVTFNYTVTDNLDSPISCDLVLNGDVEDTSNATNATDTLKYLLLTDGNYTWNVTCTDEAGNSNFSSSFNFTVSAPPVVTLDDPASGNRTTSSDITFFYTPSDPLGIDNCYMVFDGAVNLTENDPVSNQQNNFTVQGVSEGIHNWTVNCTDNDGNYHMPSVYTIIRDISPPSITLMSPTNDSGIYYDDGEMKFTWVTNDTLDDVIRCDFFVDGSLETNDKLVTDEIPTSETTNLAAGWHNWNVTCWDQVGNSNNSATYYFNFTYPDFVLNSSSISFNDTTPREGDNVSINITFYNDGGADISGVTITIYDGDPDSGGTQIGNTKNLSISRNTFNETVFYWAADVGPSEIFAQIDPPLATNGNYDEWDENNNEESKNISTGAWHFFYGSVDTYTNYTLDDDQNNSIVVWAASNYQSGNLYVADYDSSVTWGSLYALGRTDSGGVATTDFADADTVLNMTGFNDSIYNLYTTTGTPDNTSTYQIFNRQVANVPEYESINDSDFLTGILWDDGDDTGGEFDAVEEEDLVFVSKIKKDVEGTYGTYDYEIRVPSPLKNYKSGETYSAVFYFELR